MASTDDSEKLFKQMAAVNKTLEQQTKALSNVISDISTMNKTVRFPLVIGIVMCNVTVLE